MDHLCSSGSVSDCRFQDAPFADERNRYLSHCAAHGARLAVLKVKRNELRWIARRLGPDADRGVGMTELMPIALERQNLHGAATAARRVIDIGRPWLRFLGWWREPAVPFLDRGQLDRYVTWMRGERGFTPSTVEQWGRTTRRFLRWCAEAGRQLGDLTAGDIDNYVATQGKGRWTRGRKSHDQPARVAHDAARQGDQMKPHRLHAPRRPIAAEHQTLHHRVEIVGENMIAHHAALAPNSPLGSRPPARSSFITACASSLLPQRSRCQRISSSPASVRLVTRPNSL